MRLPFVKGESAPPWESAERSTVRMSFAMRRRRLTGAVVAAAPMDFVPAMGMPFEEMDW